MALSLNKHRSLVRACLVLTKIIVVAIMIQSIIPSNISTVHAVATPDRVVVNEFNSKGTADWVEIYNASGEPIDLTGWTIRDNGIVNKIDLSGSLSANSFESFNFSNRLNDSGDTIRIFDNEGGEVDSIIYGSGGAIGSPSAGEFAARIADGGPVWELRTSNSRDKSNAATVPEATLNVENFNTVDGNYRGVSVGFNTSNFGNVTDVTVTLNRATGGSITKIANQGVKDLISNQPGIVQLTTPFIIQEGSFTEFGDLLYWQPALAVWSRETLPTSVVITVTDENGSKTVENDTFNQGGVAWPAYDDLLPVLVPTPGFEVVGNPRSEDSGESNGSSNGGVNQEPTVQITTQPVTNDTFTPQIIQLGQVGRERLNILVVDASAAGGDADTPAKPDVLGTKIQEGTALSDTAAPGTEDNSYTLLGISWPLWLGVAGTLVVAWLILASIIRRVRGTEL